MTIKTIEKIFSPMAPYFVGDGFRVHNFIPGALDGVMERMNPILMMDYNSKYYFEPSQIPKGVGVHPHRGFETVTIAYQGQVEHHDSSGGGGIIGEGDVQWMTAARGVLHKEYHEKEWSKTGGIFQMVQLWINLPAKDKMSDPKYQTIQNQTMSKAIIENGIIEIIAGEYNGQKGSASTFTPLHLLNAKLKKGAKAAFNFPAHYNTALLVVEGGITVNNDKNAEVDHFVLMNNDGENFEIVAKEDSVVLVMSGEPINEPIVAHGPFVMNSRQEIINAFNDFNMGKFGYLVD